MKKLTCLLTVVMVLALITSASAIDQKGKFAIGGYGGYAFGFGDFFKKWEFGDLGSFQNKPTFSFGGKVKYGVTPNIALVGAVDYQLGNSEFEMNIPGMASISEDESWNWIGILANVQYVLTPEAKTNPYFTAGGGFYIPDEGDGKPGINAGVGVEHFFQDNLALDAGARFHMIFFETGGDDVVEDGDGGLSVTADEDSESWDNAMYVQLYIGIIFYLGVR